MTSLPLRQRCSLRKREESLPQFSAEVCSRGLSRRSWNHCFYENFVVQEQKPEIIWHSVWAPLIFLTTSLDCLIANSLLFPCGKWTLCVLAKKGIIETHKYWERIIMKAIITLGLLITRGVFKGSVLSYCSVLFIGLEEKLNASYFISNLILLDF